MSHLAAAKLLAARSVGSAGIDHRRLFVSLRRIPAFAREYAQFKALAAQEDLPAPKLADLWPVLGDSMETAGRFDPHYFHQDLWAAKKIYERRPADHYDVGSRLDGFLSHLLVFMPVTMIDVAPLPDPPSGLTFKQGDARHLPFEDLSIGSLSSLHAVEHFGLGRYGDALAPGGAIEGMRELARVLAPHGTLLFSVPIGRERLMFNAHRILSPSTILAAFNELQLRDFAAVSDDGSLTTNADPSDFADADYSCGMFEFSRESPRRTTTGDRARRITEPSC